MGELGIALVAGALTTLNPCVFPILPLVVGSALQDHRAAPLLMGLGMAAAFALLGLLTGLLAESVGLDADLIRTASAILLIVFGLAMMVPQGKELFARLVSPLADRASALSSGLGSGPVAVGAGSTAPAGSVALRALAMGMLLGFVWTPCSGPLLASTLTLAASGGALKASGTLAVFGLGAAIPLMSVGYLSRSTMGRLRAWVIAHGSRAQQVMGALLALVGLMVLLGADKMLEAALNRWLPSSWLSLTTRF
ncbi:MAG: sulfite exporter TauE/SafE family protein [Burkholderiaceae bacterium]|nr:sulfite exporter TauE/SafE family protein [Burkholderiaceae bacterium]